MQFNRKNEQDLGTFQEIQERTKLVQSAINFGQEEITH